MTTETPRWATMTDVARVAGVSKITVSRVLRYPDKVRPTTRERVREVIRDLGYIPDAAAGSLTTGESRVVAALISTLAGSTFAETVDGLTQSVRRQGRELLLASTDYSPASEESLVAAVLARRPDGLVLTATEHTERARALLARAGVPVVEVWELPERPVDLAVGFSNRAAGRAAARFLVGSGRRHVGFLGGDDGAEQSGESRGRHRREGFTAALAEAGLAPVLTKALPVGPGAAHCERGARGLAELLRHQPDLDAVFCASDALALGAVMEAGRRGLAVPDRLAIVGFGDFEFAGDHGLGLTTVRVPGHAIGRQAAELILARKAGDAAPGTVVDLGFEMVRRRTA